MDNSQAYTRFLESKIAVFGSEGFTPPSAPHESLKPHQRDVATWAIGKRAALECSKAFGLGKSQNCSSSSCAGFMNTPAAKPLSSRRSACAKSLRRLTVRRWGCRVKYCRTMAEVEAAGTPYIITNYERVVKGDIIPAEFAGATLDEASVLRSLGSLTHYPDLYGRVPKRCPTAS